MTVSVSALAGHVYDEQHLVFVRFHLDLISIAVEGLQVVKVPWVTAERQEWVEQNEKWNYNSHGDWRGCLCEEENLF